MFSAFVTRQKLRRCLLSAAVLLAAGAWVSRASADDMQFINTLHGGSSATVQFAGALSSQDVYSDILTWNDLTAKPNSLGASTLETYCIDIKGNISQGDSYVLDNAQTLTTNAAGDAYLT